MWLSVGPAAMDGLKKLMDLAPVACRFPTVDLSCQVKNILQSFIYGEYAGSPQNQKGRGRMFGTPLVS